MITMIINVILGITLFITAIQDVLIKKISVWIVVLSGVILSAFIPFYAFVSLGDRLGGLLLGISVIILSKLTQGKIGMGDGLLLCVTGLGLGFWTNMELFAIALFGAAVMSIVLLVFRLADRKKSIPFVPFLFIGYMILLVIPKS